MRPIPHIHIVSITLILLHKTNLKGIDALSCECDNWDQKWWSSSLREMTWLLEKHLQNRNRRSWHGGACFDTQVGKESRVGNWEQKETKFLLVKIGELTFEKWGLGIYEDYLGSFSCNKLLFCQRYTLTIIRRVLKNLLTNRCLTRFD